MSNETKHTLGPWEILPNGVIVSHSRNECIAIGTFTGVASSQKHIDEHPYNNSLIAAAPDLLSSLEKALKVWDTYYADACYENLEDDKKEIAVFEEARAAIAKAKAVQ